MEQIFEMLSNYGVPLIIVGLFLYDWLTTRKDMQETLKQNNSCLKEIKNTNINNAETNKNTAKSLELLQKSMDNQYEFLQIHDKRCEQSTNGILEINKELEKINIRLEEKLK